MAIISQPRGKSTNAYPRIPDVAVHLRSLAARAREITWASRLHGRKGTLRKVPNQAWKHWRRKRTTGSARLIIIFTTGDGKPQILISREIKDDRREDDR